MSLPASRGAAEAAPSGARKRRNRSALEYFYFRKSASGSCGARRLGAHGHKVFSDDLAGLAAAALGGLFVVAMALHITNEAFSLAEALEALEQLLHRLVPTWPDFDHPQLQSTNVVINADSNSISPKFLPGCLGIPKLGGSCYGISSDSARRGIVNFSPKRSDN